MHMQSYYNNISQVLNFGTNITDAWRYAKVIPLYKGIRSKGDLESYQPISFTLPVYQLYQLFESIVKDIASAHSNTLVLPLSSTHSNTLVLPLSSAHSNTLVLPLSAAHSNTLVLPLSAAHSNTLVLPLSSAHSNTLVLPLSSAHSNT